MSSYELLELLEMMDDDGRFKTALRRGDPSELRAAILQTANECSVIRAGYVQHAESERYGARLFVPPSILRAEAEKREVADSARANIYAMADISRVRGGGRRDDADREDDD